MKLIKPLRLGLLHKVYRYQRRYHLGVAALAYVPLRGDSCLLTEMELWSTVMELPDVSPIDAGIPKAAPEFLVSGNAYGRYCVPGTHECEVSVRVAGLRKALRVTGERTWQGKAISASQPFEQIPLDWAHTYGGAGFVDNPLGKGHPDTEEVRPLPNLEPLDQRLRSPEQNGTPISLGCVDAAWPQRYRLNDDFGQRWLEEDFPGLSRNIDWRYFNTAQPDQWFEGLPEIPSGAEYELHHLHPEHATLSGRLPELRARCFLRRQAQSTQIEEVPLRLTTVWFIPHLERAILVFNGSAPCTQFDGSDIDSLLVAAEEPSSPRGMPHYRNVLEQREDPRQGAIYALRDADLVPTALIGPGLESSSQEPPPGSAMMERMNQRSVAEHEKLVEKLKQVPPSIATPKVDIPEPVILTPVAPPTPDELPAFIETRETMRKDAEAKLETMIGELRAKEAEAKAKAKRVRPMAIDTAQRPPRNPQQTIEKLRQQLQSESAAHSFTPQQRQQLQETLEQGAPQLTAAMVMAGHHLEAQPALDEETSRRLRQQIQERLSQGLPLTTLPLAGANLAGMDLRKANLTGADLDSVNLSGCNLSGAILRGALLTRTQLDNANLEGCDLVEANLGLAHAHNTSLRNADLSQSCLEQSDLNNCDLSGARLCEVRLQGATLGNLNLTRARVEDLIFLEVSVKGWCLHQADIDGLTFYQCKLREFDFSQARITALSMIESDASQGLSFQAARIDKSCFIGGCDLSGADFSACEMSEVSMKGARLTGANFTFSQLQQTNLSETDLRNSRLDRAELDGNLLIRSDLRGANLRGASLMSSLLKGATLQAADLSESNLFRADLGEVLFDADTKFEGSYQQRTNWFPRAEQPKRKGEAT
jgi:uncharacterized protein YjbI with pentapeptide repeats